MNILRSIIYSLWIIMLHGALFSSAQAGAALTVYGPGGPHLAITECAEAFSKAQGVAVRVVKGEPQKQARLVATDGDIYYTGAEYMLREFMDANPGLLDEGSVVNIAPRRIGIIVRQGNPKGIRSLADLAVPGVRVLDVTLESMELLRGAANANVILSVTTGEQGFNAWNARPDLDAWVTYRTWSRRLQSGEFIPLEGPAGLRHMPVALTRRTIQPEAAAAFVRFLQSEEARAILQKYGFD